MQAQRKSREAVGSNLGAASSLTEPETGLGPRAEHSGRRRGGKGTRRGSLQDTFRPQTPQELAR